jgi:hypothetical protein
VPLLLPQVTVYRCRLKSVDLDPEDRGAANLSLLPTVAVL